MMELTPKSPTAKPRLRPHNGPLLRRPPRCLIIGAGSRGQCYASAIDTVSNGVVVAVAEPVTSKRETLGRRHIWGSGVPRQGQSFSDWRQFLDYELHRRSRVQAGDDDDVPAGVDAVFVCVLDEMHRDVVVGLAPLGLHMMCEKPLATSLDDCLAMYAALAPLQSSTVFSVGHVLRYSPHNLLLRRLLVEERILGDINSVVHTEPVGWWHFSHSYVRGNWRNHQTTAPSLLTKSCHDMDLLLWLLCSPEKPGSGEPPHLPASVSSSGALQFFKRSRKPPAAGSATNCMRCPLVDDGCKFSAKTIYLGSRCGLGRGNTGWPVNIVVHDIEDYGSAEDGVAAVTRALEEDWDETTPVEVIRSRNWFGRCVFESDNNVCDDQFVTITWPESVRPAKLATFHMAAQTSRQCDRFSRFYGEEGELYADSDTIVFEHFASGRSRTWSPGREHLGHGGGDAGLARQFVLACDAVKNGGRPAPDAQAEFVGCTLDEVLRSHVLVFAAEEARVENKVVDWAQFWDRCVAKAGVEGGGGGGGEAV
ncbi:streptomycin biosynthesis protein StrI [Ophiocordyceps camponoti-floridani]|uniref:Streptomycin biosynthesis protein StrI n=1 Tax=Ophiocordyceps camponoti-floridani TaxID=2030778 RepID=A0A8H4QBT4_9HYPO|nr:streptomycin biosynthesis protein StrI [Ophiocordyceps camponoti-floridani]